MLRPKKAPDEYKYRPGMHDVHTMRSNTFLILFALTVVCLFNSVGAYTPAAKAAKAAKNNNEGSKTENSFVSLNHPLFDINPTRLALENGKGTFFIKLKKSPSTRADATVSLMLPDGLMADACTLKFTSQNYQTEQRVEIDTHPTLGNLSPKVQPIKLEACLPDTDITSPEETKADYMVDPNSKLAHEDQCVSSGEPHIKP
ncbi:MAG: hypothetical protein SGCHY_004076, partial [Lobulomycetales sp.]